MIPYRDRLKLIKDSVIKYIYSEAKIAYVIKNLATYLENNGEEQWCKIKLLYLKDEKVYIQHEGTLNKSDDDELLENLSIETLCELAWQIQFYGINQS